MNVWIRGLMAVVLVAGLSGCGGGNNSKTNNNPEVNGIEGWGDVPEVIAPTNDSEAKALLETNQEIINSFIEANKIAKNKNSSSNIVQETINLLKGNKNIKAIEVDNDTIIIYSTKHSKVYVPLFLPKPLNQKSLFSVNKQVFGNKYIDKLNTSVKESSNV